MTASDNSPDTTIKKEPLGIGPTLGHLQVVLSQYHPIFLPGVDSLDHDDIWPPLFDPAKEIAEAIAGDTWGWEFPGRIDSVIKMNLEDAVREASKKTPVAEVRRAFYHPQNKEIESTLRQSVGAACLCAAA